MSDTQKHSSAEPLAVLEGILGLDLGTSSVEVCIASCFADDDLPQFQRLQLTENLTQEFRSAVAAAVQHLAGEQTHGDLETKLYVDGSKPDPHEIEYLDLAAHPTVRQQLEALAKPIISLPVFEAEPKFISGIRFYVIIVQPPSGEPVYFFRAYTPKRELSRSKLFAALFHQGQFDTVKGPVFLFDNGVDCFSRRAYMFISQKSNFHRIFRFFEMVRKAAVITLEVIKARIPIKNFDEFASDCQGHLQKLAKLKNIAGRPYLNQISMDELRSVIARLHLPIIIENVDGTEMVVYDRSDRWALLRLLDDDYVQSLLTNTYYEASGKRPL